jgi:hypothetical protein
MSISQNFPEDGPTLNLNFAGSKILDPRITFTRTSTGTYMGSDGLIKVAPADTPRFDHRYVNGEIESLGILVEEGRSNLVTQNSTDFNYSINNQIIATQLDIAPDGNSVLCKHDLTGATSPFLNCRANTTLSAGQTYTMSMWLKGTTNFNASFAFVGETTNEIYANTANITTSWQRFTLTFTLVNTQTSSRLQVFFGQQGEGKVISIWGAQLEQGAFVTSYIPRPVAGQQSTRNPDSVSMTGDNFSDVYNQEEGSYKVEGVINGSLPASTFGGIFGAGGGSSTSNFIFYNPGTSFGMYVSNTGQSPSSFLGKTYTVGSKFKISASYATNDFACSLNGDISTSTTSNALYKSHTYFSIGSNPIAGSISSGVRGAMTISNISYYSKQVTDSQLQNLTK